MLRGGHARTLTSRLRRALALHEVMLSTSDVLDAIDLKVDYLMSAASLDEHGRNLIYVNHYELCAEKAFGLPQQPVHSIP